MVSAYSTHGKIKKCVLITREETGGSRVGVCVKVVYLNTDWATVSATSPLSSCHYETLRQHNAFYIVHQ